ncbi:DNA mismatch endonuclease Vsr [Roseomonas hellenica]|uniref:Very short patch repair endonuclease n=2 Tax=Plastoroseomonas hellenica TaxID=2687306 RepID=A0ABS5F0N8_9PROT|nr:DNA mismatch endonuclease Vsr [Plastoroseomonas hellenica]
MQRVRGVDTTPEMAVRRALHAHGYRFRLHDRTLMGRPDIVMKSRRTVIFIHGCFWHRHQGCRFASNPKTRQEFWQTKFRSNIARDQRAYSDLAARGWTIHVVWECEVKQGTYLQPLLTVLEQQSVSIGKSSSPAHKQES